MDERTTTPVRAIGRSERRGIVREALGLYGAVVLTAVYVLPGAARTKQDIRATLEAAIKQCQSRFPALNGIVYRDTDKDPPRLARLEVPTLPDIVVYDAADLSEHDFLAPLTSWSYCLQQPSPLPWRVAARIGESRGEATTTRVHVAFVGSHGLFDGRSGCHFHSALLGALNGVPAETVAELALPAEQAGKLPISLGFLLRPVVNEYLPKSLVRLLGMRSQSSDDVWLGAAERSVQVGGLPKTKLRLFEVAAAQVEACLRVCRQHESRLTGLIVHLIAVALSRSLASRGHHYKRFIACTAIDLRSLLSSEFANVLGLFASGVDSTVSVSETSTAGQEQERIDWDGVRSTTMDIATASGKLADQPVGLLKYLSNYREWLTKRSQSRAEASFGVSNVGAFTPAQQGEVLVERLIFAQSGDATGEAFNVNVASVKGGPLHIALTWWDGMLGVEDEEVFMQEVGDEVVGLVMSIGAA